MSSAKASGADAGSGSGSAQHRAHSQGNQSRAYTAEQKAAVIRVRKCAHTAFYEILAVERSATDNEIKKAYRRLSLLTHPDKNGYDGADEAFKMVSRAFQVLSDAEKKERFDRFGGDPDSRFGAGGGAGGAGPAGGDPFAGFRRASARGGAGGPMFEEEISPEELFNRFFGGGMGGGFGPFGGGQPFVFNLGGGPGFRVHQFGGGQPRRRPRDANGREQEDSPLSVLQNMLPLILLVAVTLFSSLFSGLGGGGGSAGAIPEIRLASAAPYTLGRTMPAHRVDYWLNPADVQDYSMKQLRRLDARVEAHYIQTLQFECVGERRARERRIQDAQGWFFPDVEKLQEAQRMPMPRCQRLLELGAPLQY